MTATRKELREHADAMFLRAAEHGMEYLSKIPATVPATVRLCHNFPPSTPRQRAGRNGFRYWIEAADKPGRRKRCTCRWDAPEHWTTDRG